MICASRTCILFITIQLISSAAAQETLKRGPHGFFGMRGKKFLDQLYPSDTADKEKKNSLEIENPDLFLKRAPMGFYGVRGKKDNGEEDINEGSLIGQIDYSRESNIEEFPLLNAILEDYYGKPNQISNEIDKRAANLNSFYAVRGKKSYDNKRPFDLSFRGKFIGVRGKKDVSNSYGDDLKLMLEREEPWPKRKAQMGFFGMRGKKWSSAENEEITDQSSSN